jgi:uncharacterized membrane protein YgdD (TMEM256/DUF423 family)
VVLSDPLVLAFTNAAALGTIRLIGGVGMLAGSILLSIHPDSTLGVSFARVFFII